MTKLIFGCGYLGARVAELWRTSGDQVVIVTRSPDRAVAFRDAGYLPILADVTRPDTLLGLPPVETVLFAIGYDRTAGPSLRSVYVDGLRAALDALSAAPARIIYVSSTSVFGQTGGEWVDETSDCAPRTENGRICLEAEQLLVAHSLGGRSIRLRLAGIYGPGRIPRRAALAAGEAIPAASQGYLNLIHVDDAARVVLAAAGLHVPPPRLYTVSDGHPATRGDYYAELARLVGGPAPRFAAAEPDAPVSRRAESNKRVRNHRILEDLGVPLLYPSYREGLRDIIAREP